MVQEPCFHELRTVQQLGYIVRCSAKVEVSQLFSAQCQASECSAWVETHKGPVRGRAVVRSTCSRTLQPC